MNEKIRELAEQAERWCRDTYAVPTQELLNKKFAELIIREVFAKIEDERFEVYQPVKDSVMKHFGVEE